jgi:uncharacterized protein YPO0396
MNAACAIALLAGASCTQTETRTQAETQAAAEAAKAEAERERAETRRRLSERIDALDRRMDEYKERLSKMSRNARAEGEKRIEEMRVETRDLRAKLGRLEDRASVQWDEFKADAERAIQKAENALQDAWNRIKD